MKPEYSYSFVQRVCIFGGVNTLAQTVLTFYLYRPHLGSFHLMVFLRSRAIIPWNTNLNQIGRYINESFSQKVAVGRRRRGVLIFTVHVFVLKKKTRLKKNWRSIVTEWHNYLQYRRGKREIKSDHYPFG